MTLPPVACRRTVAVIGPKFGTASQAIDIAIRNHHGDDNVESLWYEEAEFERPLGRLVGRVVRLITQALPLPQKVRSASEWFVGTMRFRRVDSVSGQLVFARSIAPIHHLVLVKPMFLRRRDLDELRLLSGATTVSIVLWDALWRTPSIRYLMSGVRVFSTEPTDCQTFGFTMLPVPTLAARELVLNDGPSEPFVGQGEGEPGLKPSNSEQPIRLFFCGSWSIDRWLAARRLVAAVRSLESGFANQASGESAGRHFICDLHLVTTNPLVACLTKSSSASSQSLSNAAYDKRVKQCDVLLDFGRKGQSSPSERLGMAARNGKLLLTTNSQLPSAGLPIVSIKEKGWIESLMSCERAIREGRAIRDLWEENASAAASVNTVEDWARVVFRSTSLKTSKPPTTVGQEVSEPPFSFTQQVSKISERIPV